jgi:carboxypeptidase PM20D1
VAGAIRASFPGTLVTPFLSLGATDARYYTGISPNVYRFIPAHMRPEDLARMHGTNERVAVADYVGMIRFYIELLRSRPGTSGRTGHGAVTRDFTHGGRDP